LPARWSRPRRRPRNMSENEQDEGAPAPEAPQPQYQPQLDPQVVEDLQALMEQAQYDPVARVTLRGLTMAANQGLLQQVQRDLDQIPDAEERQGTEEYLRTGDYRTVAAARKAWRGDMLETSQREAERGRHEESHRGLEGGAIMRRQGLDPATQRASTVRTMGYSRYAEKMAGLSRDD